MVADTDTNTESSSSAKAITAFSFTDENTALSATVTATFRGTTIKLTVPSGTDVTALVATYTTTGTSVTVDSTEQTSGVTANDFNSDVIYTVTAVDSTTQDYTVTVTETSSPAIESFSFTEANAALSATVTASIVGTNIMTWVPFGTDVTALAATFTHTGESVTVDSIPQENGLTPNDFTEAKTYTVSSVVSGTQDYTVTVIISPSFTTVDVDVPPGGLTFPTGFGDSPTANVPNSYKVGQTEVTYVQWYAVYTWASFNGYIFSNAGREGNDGEVVEGGAAPIEVDEVDQEPVTTINWRESMVWMNALTEFYNVQNGTSLTCVYYTDGNYSTPIRTSTDSTLTPATPGSQDNPYIRAATPDNTNMANNTGTGFRLLTSNEWALAARYIVDVAVPGVLNMAVIEYYPGNYASGATDSFSNGTATDLVAVNAANSNNMTAAVKSKLANARGLYDMSGNVAEWVFDLSGSSRTLRGGGYNTSGLPLGLGISATDFPYSEFDSIGFRFARNQ
ncbi:MAG: SUMF1/EgtB/PvdO family nonheme iron enzyme [Deltaproteobacteria bacterium]|nr:SUMF1/EgtB/PvdO family nonheme iron enzyme [Deltaproteobacteria bacterium]